ncbi:MAG: tetratricopeptide repeat protein [Candidatus Omnitrophota bacterium]
MIYNNIKKIAVVFLLFTAVGSGLYFVTLKSPFLMDDIAQIVENPDIKNFDDPGMLFKKGFLPLSHAGQKDQWYRPLQALSYMGDYKLWHLNAAGYHATCIALHILNAFLVFSFLRILSRDWFVSVLSGLIFLVHPVNTEAVNYISSRGDPMLVFFILPGLMCWGAALEKKNGFAYICALLFFALALLCKETAVIFPVLAALYYFFVYKKAAKIERSAVLGFAGFLAGLAAYFILRERLPILHIGDVVYNVPVMERVADFIRMMGVYLSILVWPVGLNICRALPPVSAGIDPFFLSGILALAGLLFLAIKAWREGGDRKNIFFVGWFFAAFLPTSGLLIPTTSVAAERYMYLPAIALFYLFAAEIKRLAGIKRIRTAVLAGTVMLICFFSAAAYVRNTEWTDPIKFYSSSIERNPGSIYRSDLAKEYSNIGAYGKALALYEEVVKQGQTPEMTCVALNNIGNIYQQMGMLDKSEEAFKNILDVNPGYARAYIGLGNVYFAKKLYGKAIYEYNKVIEKGGHHPGAYLNMGICHELMQDRDAAVKSYQNAIQMDPSFIPPYGKLAGIYIRQNNLKEAERILKQSLQINPHNPRDRFFLGNVYKMKGDIAGAEASYRTALEAAPDAVPVLIELGRIYMEKGDTEGARRIYEKVLMINPGNEEARNAMNLSGARRQERQ